MGAGLNSRTRLIPVPRPAYPGPHARDLRIDTGSSCGSSALTNRNPSKKYYFVERIWWVRFRISDHRRASQEGTNRNLPILSRCRKHLLFSAFNNGRCRGEIERTSTSSSVFDTRWSQHTRGDETLSVEIHVDKVRKAPIWRTEVHGGAGKRAWDNGHVVLAGPAADWKGHAVLLVLAQDSPTASVQHFECQIGLTNAAGRVRSCSVV